MALLITRAFDEVCTLAPPSARKQCRPLVIQRKLPIRKERLMKKLLLVAFKYVRTIKPVQRAARPLRAGEPPAIRLTSLIFRWYLF